MTKPRKSIRSKRTSVKKPGRRVKFTPGNVEASTPSGVEASTPSGVEATLDRAVDFRRSLPDVGLTSRDYLTVKPVIDWLRRVAPAYATGVMIDFGCGNKPYAAFFEGSVTKYVGVDVEQNKSKSVDIVLPPGAPLPLADESIDTVLSTQVLEHVSEPLGYLREAARVLKRGGHLILTIPQSYMLHEEPHDYYRYTKYGIAYLLGKCGLRIVSETTAGGAWRNLGQIALNHKAFARKYSIPLLSKILYPAWAGCVNVVCTLFDRLNMNANDTANYMIIARK